MKNAAVVSTPSPTLLAIARMVIFTFLSASLFTGCASEIEYAPKDRGRLQDPEQEQRVFYDGWLHPGRQPESQMKDNFSETRGL